MNSRKELDWEQVVLHLEELEENGVLTEKQIKALNDAVDFIEHCGVLAVTVNDNHCDLMKLEGEIVTGRKMSDGTPWKDM